MTRRDLLTTASTLAAGNALNSTLTAAAPLPESPEVLERIRRIENGLLPEPLLRYSPVKAASLSDRMAANKVPGLSIAVINNYAIEWTRCYGVKELGRTHPITRETLFQAGSISKPVTAIAALRLAEQGRLDPDKDVNEYLTSWKVPANGNWQPRVTIRQLVTHTAGTTVHGFAGYPAGLPVPSLVQVLNGEPPANSDPILVDTIPGLQSRYSGGGYCILQQLLIDVLKKPFPEIMQELVLRPASMQASSFDQPLPPSRARYAACGHRMNGEKVPGGSHTYPEMAPAGLWTTASDLARFVLQIQLAAAHRSKDLLAPKSIAELFSQHVEAFQGFGVGLHGQGASARFEHGGWDEGFVSNFVAYQQHGIGAVVMANSDQGGADIEPEILRSIAKEYGWPDYSSAELKTVEPSEGELRGIAGTYEAKPGIRFVVRSEGKRILLAAGNQAPIELFFTASDKTTARAVNADVVFKREANGIVSGLTLTEGEREFAARKTG